MYDKRRQEMRDQEISKVHVTANVQYHSLEIVIYFYRLFNTKRLYFL